MGTESVDTQSVTFRFAITGANGYVGTIVARALDSIGQVTRLVRHPTDHGDFAWSFDSDPGALADEFSRRGITHVIHVAWDMRANGLESLHRTCVDGSMKLLAAARQAGIRHIVFISTISAFQNARSAYGRTKLEVERLVLQVGGVVLRLGLVYGDSSGGMFEQLKRATEKGRFVPLIGNGSALQYLLHEETLSGVLRRAVVGDFDEVRVPLTIAQPEGIPFRDLLRIVAIAQGKRSILIPVPWRVIYFGLRLAEIARFNMGVRSDSVISFVFQNPAPDFSALADHGITPKRLNPHEFSRAQISRAGESLDERDH